MHRSPESWFVVSGVLLTSHMDLRRVRLNFLFQNTLKIFQQTHEVFLLMVLGLKLCSETRASRVFFSSWFKFLMFLINSHFIVLFCGAHIYLSLLLLDHHTTPPSGDHLKVLISHEPISKDDLINKSWSHNNRLNNKYEPHLLLRWLRLRQWKCPFWAPVLDSLVSSGRCLIGSFSSHLWWCHQRDLILPAGFKGIGSVDCTFVNLFFPVFRYLDSSFISK